jgi:UTP--glucose-1-phosphate uridylyltransferase
MPGIFTHLRNTRAGSGGEIQLTDAIASLLAVEQVLAYRYYGTRFDCGSKLGYLKATVQLALQHPEVAEGFEAYLRECMPALLPAPIAEQPELIEPL